MSSPTPLLSAVDLGAALDAGTDVVVLEILRDRATIPGPVAAGLADRPGGHLPDAHAVDFAELLGARTGTSGDAPLPGAAQLRDLVERTGIHDDSLVAVYSHDLASSATRAWWVLRWAGLADVRYLDGGAHAWLAAGRELTRARPAAGGGTTRGSWPASACSRSTRCRTGYMYWPRAASCTWRRAISSRVWSSRVLRAGRARFHVSDERRCRRIAFELLRPRSGIHDIRREEIEHACQRPYHASEPGGADPTPIFALTPVSDLEIVDDWHTSGLEGSGSPRAGGARSVHNWPGRPCAPSRPRGSSAFSGVATWCANSCSARRAHITATARSRPGGLRVPGSRRPPRPSRAASLSAQSGRDLRAEQFDAVQHLVVRQGADAGVQHEAVQTEGVADGLDLLAHLIGRSDEQ